MKNEKTKKLTLETNRATQSARPSDSKNGNTDRAEFADPTSAVDSLPNLPDGETTHLR